MLFKICQFFLIVFIFSLAEQNLNAHGYGGAMNVNGFGATVDYGKGLGKESFSDKGAYLTYKNGFFYMVSAFITADAGWRFDQKSFNAKLGFQGMFLFLGLEAGFISKYEKEKPDNKYSPGIFLGLAGFLPMDDFIFPFFSLGTNIYLKNKETEFYASFTLFFNFWK